MLGEGLSACLTPLQKARRAFRFALRKAAQDMFSGNTTKPFLLECNNDAPDEFCEDEENAELDWLFPTTMPGEVEKQSTPLSTGLHHTIFLFVLYHILPKPLY